MENADNIPTQIIGEKKYKAKGNTIFVEIGSMNFKELRLGRINVANQRQRTINIPSIDIESKAKFIEKRLSIIGPSPF